MLAGKKQKQLNALIPDVKIFNEILLSIPASVDSGKGAFSILRSVWNTLNSKLQLPQS